MAKILQSLSEAALFLVLALYRLLALNTAIGAAEDLLNRAMFSATNPPVSEVVAEHIARIPLEDEDAVVEESI